MYDFKTLSPLDFEELVRDLLQAELKLRLESFGPGRDQGIDFRFATGNGRAIVQAKHTPENDTSRLVRVARAENPKVAKLVPQRYILATSATLNPMAKAEIQKAMPDAPLSLDDIFGREDLNNLLRKHEYVETQHFKLWLASTNILQRILHSGVYNRTQAEMEIIKELVPKFVQNDSIPLAESILAKHGSLIIAGEPGVGKSTLARMLIWLHAAQGWHISVIDDIREGFEVVDDGKKRLIFFDDFLGQVRLSSDVVRSIDQRLPPIFQKLRSNRSLRFILTTRDYIFRQAQAQSSRLDDHSLKPAEFVLNVGHYTRGVRARMLYNHLVFSDFGSVEREALLADDFFLKIVDHSNFNPRLIHLLTSKQYIALTNKAIRQVVQEVLDNPQELWEKPYRNHISDEGRALLMALYFNGKSVHLDLLKRSFERKVAVMGLNIPRSDMPARFRAALKELEGSAIAIQEKEVSFSNPGLRDFLQRAIKEDGFMPAAVDAALEFAEVSKTWDLFWSQKPDQMLQEPAGAKWIQAARRLLADGSGTALERLGLFVDIYDRVSVDDLLPVVEEAIVDLEHAQIDAQEVDNCCQLLEALVLTLLPFPVVDEAKRVLTHSVATMLEETGGYLSLDEFKAVSDALIEHGADEDMACKASRKALEVYLEEIEQTIDEYSSVTDLEEFERDLFAVLTDHGIVRHDVVRVVERRKERLIEREMSDENNYHGGNHTVTRQGMTDSEIRSMFLGLRHRTTV